MTLNIGVIGAGRIGKVHAETLVQRVPGVSVIAVADVIPAAAQDLAGRLHIGKATADYKEILADKNIQAIAICSATDTHSQIIMEAAAAGKHIFCEKPIDLDLARIDKALAAVAKAGVKLQIGFNRRFDANYARVRQAIESGEIGELHMLHIISRDPAPPPISYIKVSGGIFMDMTIHDFDMARFLTGSEALEVYTIAGVKVDPAIGAAGDVDTAFIVMKFANGATVTIDNSRKAVYGYDQRVEAFGSNGTISTDNIYPNAATISNGQSIHRDLPLNFFMQRYTQSYESEMQAFVNAVVNNQPVPVSGADGRAPVVMGLAAKKSHLENRPVKLSEI
jgi:myo-inositol 2-dehydrogenase / D-chiro-inositol 1-dehydrogenase